MTVLAHVGHWLAGLAYAAPVIVLAGWLGVVKVKERRGHAPEADDVGAGSAAQGG